MKALFVIASESMALDRVSHKLSIFNIIEKISVPSVPFIIPFMTVVAMVERQPDEPGLATIQVRVTIDGNLIANPSVNLDFAGTERIKIVQNISGILVRVPGNLRLELDHGGTVLSAWDVHVDIANQPIIEAPPAVRDTPAVRDGSAKQTNALARAQPSGRKRRSTPKR
jgi:hypothetical protein